ncbi:MAG TPA: MarR family winged helix-turn-helix transcriptional regulator [Candidatus Krumholzibacteria bacterium]|nr:MarR family winged helix-turn-helix transcriptional regulator [Candidatus Krumholzibacteria bacterium]
MVPNDLQRSSTPEDARAFFDLVDEVRALFHRLRAAGDAMLADEGINAGQRGLLFDIARDDRQTVPDLARKRPVSRQSVQTQMDHLIERGLVERRENPEHKTAWLHSLTDEGRATVDRVRRRELRWVERAGLPVPVTDLDRARNVLAQVREHVELEGP